MIAPQVPSSFNHHDGGALFYVLGGGDDDNTNDNEGIVFTPDNATQHDALLSHLPTTPFPPNKKRRLSMTSTVSSNIASSSDNINITTTTIPSNLFIPMFDDSSKDGNERMPSFRLRPRMEERMKNPYLPNHEQMEQEEPSFFTKNIGSTRLNLFPSEEIEKENSSSSFLSTKEGKHTKNIKKMILSSLSIGPTKIGSVTKEQDRIVFGQICELMRRGNHRGRQQEDAYDGVEMYSSSSLLEATIMTYRYNRHHFTKPSF